MADKVKVEIDRAAIGRILRSKEMLDLTARKAAARYADATLKPYIGFDRAKTRVIISRTGKK